MLVHQWVGPILNVLTDSERRKDHAGRICNPAHLHGRRSNRMRQPSPSISDLARRLLRHEAAAVSGPLSPDAAVDRVCDKLRTELEQLIGPGGADALIRRARVLAKREFPFLDGDIDERTAGPAEVETANTAVLAHLLGLLVGLLGMDLGLRPVLKIWPDVRAREAEPRSTEKEV